MSDKTQLCIVCGSYINYPLVDMVLCKGGDGNAHLECAWNSVED